MSAKTENEIDGDYLVKNIPHEVRSNFKARCARAGGKTMRDVMIAFMKAYGTWHTFHYDDSGSPKKSQG